VVLKFRTFFKKHFEVEMFQKNFNEAERLWKHFDEARYSRNISVAKMFQKHEAKCCFEAKYFRNVLVNPIIIFRSKNDIYHLFYKLLHLSVSEFSPFLNIF